MTAGDPSIGSTPVGSRSGYFGGSRVRDFNVKARPESWRLGILYPLSSVNFHKGVHTRVNVFRHAERAFRIKCYFDRDGLRRVNQCKQREKQGRSVGAVMGGRRNIYNFAMERALFNCLDSDCGPLTELYVFQLIFIEICNYPWIVSSEESLDYLMSRLWQKKPLINTSCSPQEAVFTYWHFSS